MANIQNLLQQLTFWDDLEDLRQQGLTEEEITAVIHDTQDDYWLSLTINTGIN